MYILSVSTNLLAEYAYVLKFGGILYTITDVEDLHQWMAKHLDAHPLFERLTPQEESEDPCVKIMTNDTEESKKAAREGRGNWPACYRRIAK